MIIPKRCLSAFDSVDGGVTTITLRFRAYSLKERLMIWAEFSRIALKMLRKGGTAMEFIFRPDKEDTDAE